MRPEYVSRSLVPALIALLLFGTPDGVKADNFAFQQGDRIALIGNGLADRKQHDGWLETYLQAAHPELELVFRNLAVTGDQVDHRPRAHEGFGSPDTHLSRVNASVILAFFGYNESYDDQPEQFRQALIDWVEHTRGQQYDGENPPRIVLFSPIAHEDLNDPALPDGSENNPRLAAYTEAMAEAAAEMDVAFVDLFTASQRLYEDSDQPLTINGVHPGTEGNRQLARVITESLLGSLPAEADADLEPVRQAVVEKNWHWLNRYRAPSGNDVWGSRAELHGNYETLQQELTMIDVMVANRDERIWARAQGGDLEIDDSNVPPPIEVETNYHDADNVVFLDGEEAIERMTLADGLQAELFASEQQFPEIANPVQMQLDTQGRLWVAAWPTYPKWEPLKEMTDGLVILEDTNGDGRADSSTTFAHIHNPTGFEFWNDGVIVASAPNIWFLKDTTGDDKADTQVLLMSAIDSGDTHHTANNLVLGPDGYIYYQRGVFHLHSVETPWDRAHESTASALYRFNPRTHRFDYVVDNSPNPHGISFDGWGYHYITDATSGSPFQVYVGDNGFEKRRLFNQTVRPVPGNVVLSSEHLGEEFENNFLILNTIGFLGIKRYELIYDNGAVSGEEIGDLIVSDDPNFRPTDAVVGDDGALYVSDWHNPLIGHMQHNLRDPMRDHDHGRIYRITHEDRPLQEPVAIHGEPIADLLDLLEHPVNNVRHRVRVELTGRDTADVIAATQQWTQQFDAGDEGDGLPLLEALWIHQQHDVVNRDLLEQVLQSPNEHVRQAAERVEWEWRDRSESDLVAHAAGNHDGHGSRDPAGQVAAHAVAVPDGNRTGETLDLTGVDIAELTIKAVVEQMRYDVAEFTVKVGQPVVLTFENPDFMPHNLLVVEPGMADEVAIAAIQLGAEGFAMQFVPDHSAVMHATRMLNAQQSETLEFDAPTAADEYPFVCTFPGHHTLMRGVMHVVE